MALFDSSQISKLFGKRARKTKIFRFNLVVITLMLAVVAIDSLTESGIIASPTIVAVMGIVATLINTFLKLTGVKISSEPTEKTQTPSPDETRENIQ